MSWETLLQIFIYLQVFAMGALAVIAVRNARAHFGTKATPKQEYHEDHPAAITVDLPHDVKERLVESSQKQFQDILGQSANKLEQDLGITTGHINNLVMRLASEIVSGELERYRADLAKLHEQANANMGGVSAEVAKHKEEIKAKVAEEFEAEKQRLLKQIDTKLADAVGSFLLEALGNNVDLGGQSAYLVGLLEEHKTDFVKEVSDESQSAK